MRCLSLALAIVFVVGPAPLYSQVGAERGRVNGPFTTYEDTNLMDPGTLTISSYASFSRNGGANSWSAPGIDFSLGLLPRFELSGFGAVAYSRDDQDRLTAQLDDSYLGLKVLLSRERRYLPAIAVKPTFELLSSTSGTDRAHFLVPLILQKDTGLCDLAYTAGYVTRGVAFSSLKCERSIGDRITAMAVLDASRMTRDLRAISDLGLNRTQIDGSVGVDIDISPTWSIFVEAGRTLSRRDENSSSFEFTASISYTGRLWGRSASTRRKHIPALH